jgi:lipopolysaccharide/colanic/teichoic acid biosynthesis glycosyltransferase
MGEPIAGESISQEEATDAVMDSTRLDSNPNGIDGTGLRALSRVSTIDEADVLAESGGTAPETIDGGGVVTMPRLNSPAAEAVVRGLDAEPALGALAHGVKRCVDLIGAVLAIVLLAPLWLMIAILIKADSPGPVLFRQRRIGRGGQPFSMLKFRTMVDGADAHKPALLHLNQAGEGLFKIQDDPRITRIGRWLRTTCLDELPQLIHVITGKMSLVGPRPLVPEEDARIRGMYRDRLMVRPGMTGPWQVEGASAIPIHEMVLLDRYYLEAWSLWLDLKLLAKTAGLVVARRGL